MEYVREVIPQAYQALHTKAMLAAKSVGLDGNSYDDWRVWADTQAEGKHAMSALAFAGDVGPIKELAQKYLANVKPSQAALKGAGMRTWTDSTGVEFVDVPGYGPISVAAASKLKLI